MRQLGCGDLRSRRAGRLAPAAVAGLLIAIAGCGEKTVELPKVEGEPNPVRGKVLLPGGAPLVNGTVVFVPVKEPGLEARGTTASDGSFELTTRQPKDGAMAGDYQVRLEPPPPPVGRDKPPPPPFPTKYLGEASSGLVATVKAGPNELAPFRLDLKPSAKAAATARTRGND